VFLETFLAPVVDRDRVSEPERAIASASRPSARSATRR
jgi:hypothetical protein